MSAISLAEGMLECAPTFFEADTVRLWYAIYTKPAKEDLAIEYISRLGIEAFNPKIKQFRRVWGELKEIYVPPFPCYVFAKFNGLHNHSIKYAHGVRRIVGMGNVPTPIEEQIVALIKTRSIQSRDCIKSPEGEPGDPVVINGGMFYGFEGIFVEELSGKDRVRILLSTIIGQARFSVSVEKRWIQRAVS